MAHLPTKAGDTGSIPGPGRSPGGGNGTPLQDSCLENPMDRQSMRSQRGGYDLAKSSQSVGTDNKELRVGVRAGQRC